ncbi:MAG: capsular biosynthesis protein [Bacteroidales bacterium]|jgi:tyrosine-protein phosphatase YwqE|nr:capsular biosynthesis protein [Bacteroidales bacterium]
MFKKKVKLKDTGFFNGFTDNHSHILPGVDDGVQSNKEALAVLNCMAAVGFKEIWFTPHIMRSMYNTTADLCEKFDLFRNKYTGPLKLHLAAEYMLDARFEKEFFGCPLCLYDKYVLLETSCIAPPFNFYDLLYEISLYGYVPLIAHPERYIYMNKNDYRELKNKEYLLQLNLFSLYGIYGHAAKKKAEYLLKNGMYDVIGTDIHSIRALEEGLESLCVDMECLGKLMDIRHNYKFLLCETS